MIKTYGNNDYDNVMVESKHNAFLIASYLHNMARFLDSDLTDEQYGLLCRCSDLLWTIEKNLPEE